MLRSVAYQGRRQISSPVAAEVRDASGATHRAEYIDNSMVEHGVAHYLIAGVRCALGRDGALRPVAERGRQAA
jgi:hypothetical protein